MIVVFRENVDKHFINESHKSNLDKLVNEKMVEVLLSFHSNVTRMSLEWCQKQSSIL